MSRVKGIFKPADIAIAPELDPADVKAVFDQMYPGIENPEFDDGHTSYAVAARSPKLALQLIKATHAVLATGWSQRRDLLELSIQTLSLHYQCDLMFKAHLPLGPKHGLSVELQAAIPYWRKSDLFNDEQRLVIEYTLALASGDVPEALFARVVAAWGETGAVEFTSTAGLFCFWAIFMNATRP